MGASLGGDVVQLHDVSKRFGKFEVVKSVSWSLGRGGVYGLIGENGAGKSTLIRMICGLTRPTAAGSPSSERRIRRTSAMRARTLATCLTPAPRIPTSALVTT